MKFNDTVENAILRFAEANNAVFPKETAAEKGGGFTAQTAMVGFAGESCKSGEGGLK